MKTWISGAPKKSISVRIPTILAQDAVACRRQRHEIADARARRKSDRRLSRQIEKFEEPFGRDLFNRGGGGRWRVVPSILAPSAREPVGGHTGRVRTSKNPAEETWMHHLHQTRFAFLSQVANYLSRICAGFRQWFREFGPHFMIVAYWHAWSTGSGRPIFDGLVKRFAKRV